MLVSRAYKKGLNLGYLLRLSGLSVSGYYKYLQNKDYKKERDKDIVNLINQICKTKKYKIGIRIICMILNNKYHIKINLKKILRIKRAYKIPTKIRKKNPYNIFTKRQLESQTAPNILQREFRQKQPDKVYSTDISYLFYTRETAYLSATKDLASKEIVAFNVNTNLGLQTAYQGLENLLKTKKVNGLIIHSDQGVHYTNLLYINKLKEFGVTQSMSRKGNCLDNAPIESFFGHLKDEIDLKSCQSFEEVKELVENYIYYYNNERYQWNINKMTPVEYRRHLLQSSS